MTMVWFDVCGIERLPTNRGVCALIHGEQVAVFRTAAGQLYAVGNNDPFSGANVISRGLIGSVGNRVTVTSPMYKQRFDLVTGECVDEPSVHLLTYSVRERCGRVELAL